MQDKFPENAVKAIPLGGLGEIGLNMMVFETAEDAVVIDCGLLFPDESMLGIDLVLPDATYVESIKDKLRGIIITHGHEDHIGALPFLWPRMQAPVFATRFTLALLEGKLREFELLNKVVRHQVDDGGQIKLGNTLTAEFFTQEHSIPDSAGVALRTPAGLIIFSADFKFSGEDTPKRRELDARLQAFGEEGVRVLFCDSTNAEREGVSGKESDVGRNLERIFDRAPGRVIVTCFASAIARMQQVLDICARQDRTVCVTGKSMVDNLRISSENGYIKLPPKIEFEVKSFKNANDPSVCILTTGSQGEPLSALTRMAFNEHKQIKIGPQDTVILSSRIIPGNERSINRVIDNLFRRGADVLHERIAQVHVSGHGSRGEIERMIELVQPQCFVPSHGEYRHLKLNADIAVGKGVDRDCTVVAEDGDVILIDKESISIIDKVTAGRVFVDGKGVGDVEYMVLRDRRNLAYNGLVVAIATVDRKTGELLGEIEIISKGVITDKEGETLFNGARQEAEIAIRELSEAGPAETADIAEQLRLCIRRYLKKNVFRRPVVIPIVMNM
jgi:ribonuclease J